ncbi:DNA/RNA polymerase [Patellaria atrata CBS 101060]|uniref:DNA polymerase eta n=1 Tax=Patellaria atrata CBS 101060 TaxID=1346257 RepID=A0A9P4SJ08_9PEZI|nr:DNA/RNA polymerase [Patellaria atrata CBS 101060]
MSSPPFLESSHCSLTRGQKSRFTYKHLSLLSQYSTASPLRVVAHIDLDAFYAQCEMVRLDVQPDQPLAVQQWQGLIAINYPARKYGLTRHVTATEARKICPELIMQHVATWKEGDEKWAYHEDAWKHMGTHKVSLDPYRMESRKILKTIKDSLPDTQRVEKASIDEVFLDLSKHVYDLLLERYPELRGPPPYDDATENLPRPTTTALDWQTDALIDLDITASEDDDPDWDDIAILIGSEIVRNVRKNIYDFLHYTCSSGIARNKMLAKLGSGHQKPNAQTVIRNRAVSHFLSSFKFTKIRNLGGKLGDEVVAMFSTDTVSDLLGVSLEQFIKNLGEETGTWLYNTIRGEDKSEVNPRVAIKSMLSAKSFRPSINDFPTAVRWLRIFAADIFSRCVEEGVLENRRRPKTINLHYRTGQQTRSKQSPLPMSKTLSEEMLLNSSKLLLAQIVADGRAWPCSNLSLSVGGWEEGVTGNQSIGGFLVRGDEAKAMLDSEREASHISDRQEYEHPYKKRKLVSHRSSEDEKLKIDRFFSATDASPGSGIEGHTDSEYSTTDQGHEQVTMKKLSPPIRSPVNSKEAVSDNIPPSAQHDPCGSVHHPFSSEHPNHKSSSTLNLRKRNKASTVPLTVSTKTVIPPQHQFTIESFLCSRCSNETLIPIHQKEEHEDWHFAKALAKELRDNERIQGEQAGRSHSSLERPKIAKAKGGGRGRPSNNAGSTSSERSSRVEKGQQKLAFGRG